MLSLMIGGDLDNGFAIQATGLREAMCSRIKSVIGGAAVAVFVAGWVVTMYYFFYVPILEVDLDVYGPSPYEPVKGEHRGISAWDLERAIDGDVGDSSIE